MPGKTKVELIRLTKERVKEISSSKLLQEEKVKQLVPYLRILRSLDKQEVTERLCEKLGVSVGAI